MQVNHSLSIIFQLKENPIPLKFDLLDKVSQEISHTLIFSIDHKYTVKSKVSEIVFKLFLENWINGTPIDIQINNIDDFIQLNQEFQFKQLDELIKSKEEEFGEDLQYFNCIKNPNQSDRSKYEERIAKRLDDYLNRYQLEMMKLPITSLFNIFNHLHRNLQDHNHAYDLIKNHFENTRDSNIFSLLPSLDGMKLSKENLNEAIALQENRFGYHPTIDTAYLANAIEIQKNHGIKIIEIEEKINQQQNSHKEFEEHITSLIDQLKQNINELELITGNQKQKIKELKKTTTKQSKTIDELKNTVENQNKKIDSFSKTTNKQFNSIEELKDKVRDQKQEIEELKTTVQKQAEIIDKNRKHNIEKANEIESEIDKTKNSLISSIHNNLLRFFSVEPNINSNGIFHILREKEKNCFDRLVVASQSLSDIYNLIDPNTEDRFGSTNEGNFFIKFELKESVMITGIKIFNSYRNFSKSFDIEIDGEIVKSIKEAHELNGKFKEMKIDINPKRGKAVKIIQTGMNWDENNNFIEFKRFEILSNEPKYSEGVFYTLVGESENRDPHKSAVHITSSRFDFNSFHLLNSQNSISIFISENSWFQVELTQGSAIITGIALKKNSNNKLRSFKIIGTHDNKIPVETWPTLIQVDEKTEDEHEILDMYEFDHPSPPVKFIRMVQTDNSWSGNLKLSFYYFDIFGIYI